MSTTIKGVAKKTEKKDILVIASEKNAMLRKKLAPQLCNDYFAVSCGALKPDQFILATG
jgi:hypothetical protein